MYPPASDFYQSILRFTPSFLVLGSVDRAQHPRVVFGHKITTKTLGFLEKEFQCCLNIETYFINHFQVLKIGNA